MLEFILVQTKEQIQTTACLAEQIWTEHYSKILEPEQINYMVKKFQSAEAIDNQIAKQDYRYYLLFDGKRMIGYTAIQPDGKYLFLSKIYIEKQERGKKYAAQTIQFLENICRKNGWSKLWLTVNKENSSSIAAYQAMGFHTTKAQVTDIGNGFVMDDYIMEKIIDS